MTTKNCLLGTLVGGLVMFFLGYALYGLLLASFFEANAGSATGVDRDAFNFPLLLLGQFAWAGALTTVMGWKGVRSATDGFTTGINVGFLFFLGFDLTLYSTTNLSTITGAIVDAVVAGLLFGVTGAVIALVVGKK